jgi:tetratricopeptide (TPR) repeat protein
MNYYGLGQETTPREVAYRLYDEGQQAYNSGNLVLAERKFREAYATIPNASVLVSIGRTVEDQGRTYEAYQIYERYLQQEPTGPAATLAREGMARTTSPKQVTTTAPVPSGGKPVAKPSLTPTAAPTPLQVEEVYGDAKGPSIAVWVVTGVGVLGLMGLGYWLTRPKKTVTANRRRRYRR